jgi:mono/diheme cytochrome c family protein
MDVDARRWTHLRRAIAVAWTLAILDAFVPRAYAQAPEPPPQAETTPAIPSPAPDLDGPATGEPAPPGSTNALLPTRPQEPRAAKAYAVFDAYCARCHQTGKLEEPMASGGLANILSIDDLIRDPRAVRPGLPDASRLYDVMMTRHAPLDVYAGRSEDAEPRPEDIETIRQWIKDTVPEVQSCAARKPIAGSEIEGLIRDAQRIAGPEAKDVRFVSLAHLYNACATEAEIAGYRQALTKLVNSLSWANEAVELDPLDSAGTLLMFRMSKLGWIGGHWDLVQRTYPKALLRGLPEDIRTASGVAVPLVNGDWLAAAVSDTPLYYSLLGLPSKLIDLAKMNGVDIDQNVKNATARRVAVRASAITRGNRLIERHTGGRGGFWLVYDFATSTGDQDIFERPLGPKATATVKAPFKPDQIRVMFALPNGLFAYGLYDAAGNRIDRVLPGIEKPYRGQESAGLEPGTRAGGNCFACHTSGLKSVRDDFRAVALPETSTLGKDVRDAALVLYPSDSEMALLLSADIEKSRKAFVAAGIDPALTLGGEEIVSALARRYRGEADLKAASAEAGVATDVFISELAAAKGAAAPLARRLQQGVLSRDELDRLFALLKGADAPSERASAGGFLRDVKAEIGLSLWLDKQRPAAGELVTVKAEADSDCFMTVVSVDADGKATVLFPNDFETDNLVPAGTTLSIPSANSPYQLRFKADGTETLLARCSTSPSPPTGIEHDFERQRFTALGNWENFIQDTLETDAELRRNPDKAARARAAKVQALSRRQARGERLEQPRSDTSPNKVLRDGRAVIIIGNG